MHDSLGSVPSRRPSSSVACVDACVQSSPVEIRVATLSTLPCDTTKFRVVKCKTFCLSVDDDEMKEAFEWMDATDDDPTRRDARRLKARGFFSR